MTAKPRARGRRAAPQPLGRPLRILFCSDAPDCNSGYAVEARQIVPALRDLGVEVAFLATYGHQGAIREWNGIRVYPGGADPFANDAIPPAARDWQADAVITLKDVPVFQPTAFQGLRWVPMTPVDHEPLTPQITERLRTAYRPIAYAPNGYRALRQAGFDPLFAPHSYDPGVYFPTDKAAARQQLGLPLDRFLVGTVAVNRGGWPSRKAWPQNIEGVARFAQQHPDILYMCHTDMAADGFEGGLPLEHFAARYGCPMGFCEQTAYRRQTYTETYMRTFYNALDVLLATSQGEGFGIPQLEAQACSVPVITSGWTASEDLCFGGWLVTRDEAWREPDAQLADIFKPQPAAIADRLEQAYVALRDERTAAELRAAALAGAEAYSLPTVISRYWRPLVDELAASIAADTSRGVLRIIRPEEVGIEQGRAA